MWATTWQMNDKRASAQERELSPTCSFFRCNHTHKHLWPKAPGLLQWCVVGVHFMVATQAEAVRSAARPLFRTDGFRRSIATLGTDVLAEIRADWALYALVGAYLAASTILALAIGEWNRFLPFMYWSAIARGTTRQLAPLAALSAGLIVLLAVAVRRNPKRPITAFFDLARPVCRRLPAGLALVAAIGIFFGTFSSIKNMLPSISRFGWDAQLADFDRFLHGGVNPTDALVHSFNGPGLLAIDFLYGRLWILLVLAVSTLAAFSAARPEIRRQFLLTLFVSWILIGNLLAAIFLSGGPCFYGELTGDHSRFASLTQAVPAIAQFNQDYLWYDFQHRLTGLGTGISAFPSVHIAGATLIALLLFAIERRLVWIGIGFVILMEVGSVRLGWHYAIDGYLAIPLTVSLWWLMGRFCNRVVSQRNEESFPVAGNSH